MGQDFFQLPEEEMRKNWRKALDKALEIGLDTFKLQYLHFDKQEINPKLFSFRKVDNKRGEQFPFDLAPKTKGITEFTGEFNKETKELLAEISPVNEIWIVNALFPRWPEFCDLC